MLIYETPKMQVTTDTPKRPYRIPECNAPRYTSGILHCVLTCVRTPFRMTRGWGFHREVQSSRPQRAGLFNCFAGFLFRGLGGRVEKKLAQPRRAHRRRWQPSSPMQVPHPDWRLPVSRIRPVLLGLGVRSVGDEHPAVGLLPQRLRFSGRGNAAGEPSWRRQQSIRG